MLAALFPVHERKMREGCRKHLILLEFGQTRYRYSDQNFVATNPVLGIIYMVRRQSLVINL